MVYLPSPAIKLFVGGHASRVQGEVQDLTGARCFSAAHRPQVCKMETRFPTETGRHVIFRRQGYSALAWAGKTQSAAF